MVKQVWEGGKLSLWGEGGIQSQQQGQSTKPATEETVTTLSKPCTSPGPKLDTETRVLRKEKTFEKPSTHQLV